MKKLLSLLLIICMCLSLAACKSEKVDTNHDEEQPSNISSAVGDINEEDFELADDEEKTQTNEETQKNEETSVKEETTNKKEEKDEKPVENKPSQKEEIKQEEKPGLKDEAPKAEETAKTMGTSIANDFKSKYQNYTTSLDLANALCQNPKLEFGPMAMEVEEGFLTGFDNSEITGFKDGAMFAPMIGTIPFVGYVFTLKDGADVNAFKQNLKSSANMRWNICTQADEMICISQGNKVLFVMCKNGEE